MRRLIRKVIAFVLALSCLLSIGSLWAGAEDAVESFPDTSEASAVYFYHLESGRCMGAKNETQRLPAGSTVKLLAGMIFCEKLGQQLQDVVQIQAEMLQGVSGYCYSMKAGEVYTVEQLLYLSVCAGYNDAFYVLAYLIGGGDVSAFVDQMNLRARELGANDTAVTDPTGILDSSFTSAMDLFRISQAAIENELYLRLSGSEHYYDESLQKNKPLYNRNALISKAQDEGRYYNSKCKGLTAGFTNLGGWSVVALSQSENDRYLCVVLGGAEGEGKNPEKYGYVVANRLIKWGYDNYRYVEVLNEDTVICSIPVEVSDVTDSVEVKPLEALSFYLPADAEVGKDVYFNIRLTCESLEAPVEVGTHVGYVAVIYDGEILGTVAIYTAQSAERSGFVSRLTQIRKLTESRAARAGLIFFAVGLIAWILTEYVVKRAKRHKWDRYFSEKIDTSETFLKKK